MRELKLYFALGLIFQFLNPASAGAADWKVFSIAEDPETLYLHDESSKEGKEGVAISQLIRTNRSVFKQLVKRPSGTVNQFFGSHPHLEQVADRACQSKPASISAKEVARRMIPSLSDHPAMPYPSSLFAMGSFLWKAIPPAPPAPNDPGPIVFTDIVITCRDVPGQRVAMAQERSSGTLSVLLVVTVTGRSARNPKLSKTEKTELMIKASRLALSQINGHIGWLESLDAFKGFNSENREHSSAYYALKETNAELLRSFNGKLKALESSYKGTLKPEELLTEADLDKLDLNP